MSHFTHMLFPFLVVSFAILHCFASASNNDIDCVNEDKENICYCYSRVDIPCSDSGNQTYYEYLAELEKNCGGVVNGTDRQCLFPCLRPFMVLRGVYSECVHWPVDPAFVKVEKTVCFNAGQYIERTLSLCNHDDDNVGWKAFGIIIVLLLCVFVVYKCYTYFRKKGKTFSSSIELKEANPANEDTEHAISENETSLAYA